MEPEPPNSKLGPIAGVLALMAVGGVRLLDDCARVGFRAGRHADDVATAGARFGSGHADELAGAGGRFGGRHADELAGGSRVAQGADPGAAGRWALVDDLPHASTSESNELLEAVVEQSLDVALEVIDVPLADAEYDDEGDDGDGTRRGQAGPRAGSRQVALAVACPARVDLSADPERWRRLVDTGFGAACAPHLVFGRSVVGNPEMLVWGDAQRHVQQVAADCWNSGTTCVIVACDDDCGERIAAASRGTVDLDASLEAYTAQMTRAVLRLDPKPRVVAVVRGDRAPQLQMIVR